MGRKTWDSIPSKFRPLEGRTNVVLSHSTTKKDYPDNVLVATSLQDALEQLNTMHTTTSSNNQQIFVIGGAQVYQEAIDTGLVKRVIYTEVSNLTKETQAQLDAFFPNLPTSDWECRPYGDNDNNGGVHAKSGLAYKFLDYTRIPEGPELNPEEMQYLELCRDIIDNGVRLLLDCIAVIRVVLHCVTLCYIALRYIALYCVLLKVLISHYYPSPTCTHTGPQRRSHRYWNFVEIWDANALFSPRWHLASANDQADLLARSCRRTLVVY